MRFSVKVLLLLVLVSCAPPPHASRDSSVVIERLYFGRNAGDSLFVTDSLWTVFLSEVVTPRFPQGLTAWRAEGQWRGSRGLIEKEPSFVLEIVHPADRQVDQYISEVISEYKRRFRQEAVLRLQTDGRATY